VSAYEHKNIVDITNTPQQTLVRRLSKQSVPMDRRQAVMGRIQLLREKIAFGQGLNAVKGDAWKEWHIFERR
jgi:hypothetical protein